MQHLLRFVIFIIVIQKQKSTGFHKKFLTFIVMRHLWYEDRIEIHFNYTDLIRPDAEKRRAFSFYKFSKDVVMKRKSNLPLEKKTIRFEMYV